MVENEEISLEFIQARMIFPMQILYVNVAPGWWSEIRAKIEPIRLISIFRGSEQRMTHLTRFTNFLNGISPGF
jgi:hypothetical protein